MNMLDSYVYNVNLDWTHDRSGILGAETLPPIYYSAPPEFSGEAGKWTPEHMLVGSVASCFVSTFLAVAEHYKLEVLGLRMGAFARLEKLPGEGYRFTEITLFPEIRVAADAVETALKVLNKSEKNCFVAKSLKATIQIEPKFLPVNEEVAV